MDYIKYCFKEYNGAFTMQLKNARITGDLARQFLAETASSISYTIKNTSLEKTIRILLSDEPSQILSSINIDTMATNLGISVEQVSAGLEAIAPVMTQVFKLKCNEIVAAAASSAWSQESDTTRSAVSKIETERVNPSKRWYR